jgi:hypothetical protein
MRIEGKHLCTLVCNNYSVRLLARIQLCVHTCVCTHSGVCVARSFSVYTLLRKL